MDDSLKPNELQRENPEQNPTWPSSGAYTPVYPSYSPYSYSLYYPSVYQSPMYSQPYPYSTYPPASPYHPSYPPPYYPYPCSPFPPQDVKTPPLENRSKMNEAAPTRNDDKKNTTINTDNDNYEDIYPSLVNENDPPLIEDTYKKSDRNGKRAVPFEINTPTKKKRPDNASSCLPPSLPIPTSGSEPIKILSPRFQFNECGKPPYDGCRRFWPQKGDLNLCECGHSIGFHREVRDGVQLESNDSLNLRPGIFNYLHRPDTQPTNTKFCSPFSEMDLFPEPQELFSYFPVQSTPSPSSVTHLPLQPLPSSTSMDSSMHLPDPLLANLDLVDFFAEPSSLASSSKDLPYIINFIIQKHILNGELTQSDITQDVLDRLNSLDIVSAVKLLEDMSYQRALDKLNDYSSTLHKNVRILGSSVVGQIQASELMNNLDRKSQQMGLMYHAKITEEGVFLEGPKLEQLNRMVRKYGSDRILRVAFALRTNDGSFLPKSSIVKEYGRYVHDGLVVCGRKFEMLAYSNSGMKLGHCFFVNQFLPGHETISISDILASFGEFDLKTNASKYASRIGLSFTTTTPTIEIQPDEIEEIPDVVNNGFIFTDGCGQISPDLVKDVVEAYYKASGKRVIDDYMPSAIQARFGPCKGMFVVNPQLKRKVRYTPSMKKYSIDFKTADVEKRIMEVVKLSQSTGDSTLNRQFILLLSSLGVPEELFLEIQGEAVELIRKISSSPDRAWRAMEGSEDDRSQQVKKMLMAGQPLTEPFLRDQIERVQEEKLAYLKEKAKIPVKKSRRLFGVADPFGVLEEGQIYLQITLYSPTSPGAVRTTESCTITGTVALCRNPALHPGDVRLAKAVDIKELSHLQDVVVFSIKGSRPMQDMLSGGDLDGDEYFVTWNPALIEIKEFEPMKYFDNEKGQTSSGNSSTTDFVLDKLDNTLPEDPVKRQQIIRKQFVDQLFSTSVGELGNLHLAMSDKFGAKHEFSLHLAKLFSIAIDSGKTGLKVTVPPDYRLKFQDSGWPHFLGRSNFYKSKNVLGKLYDQAHLAISSFGIERTNSSSSDRINRAKDPDLLLPGREPFFEEAVKLLEEYSLKFGKASSTYARLPAKRREFISHLNADYRRRFLAGHAYNDPILWVKASAWYDATYTHAKTVNALAFSWNIVWDYINLIKSYAINRNNTKIKDQYFMPTGVPEMLIHSLAFKK
eukprot:TRINITY_DN5823_c0_g1_i1.p1 TRINITY_DN5823_c0_g1~~TRINITY_DN5823_c0_g1_i1.p1  ORF type:complete len:1193 (-),score=162.72 TRINITY_DN5823_c0_g1_i1:244-3822(-)